MNLCFVRQNFSTCHTKPSRRLHVHPFGQHFDSESKRKIRPDELPGVNPVHLPWKREKPLRAPTPGSQEPEIGIIIREEERRRQQPDIRPQLEIPCPEPPRKKEG